MNNYRLQGCFAAMFVAILTNTGYAQTDPRFDAAKQRVLAQPASVEASFQLAQAAAAANRYREAITALERVLLLNPGLSNIRLELGVLYLRVGQTALAEEFIEKALEDPQAPPQVRARAEEFLSVSQRGNSRSNLSGSVTAGIIADTNANSGPDFGVVPEDTGQSDISAFFRLNGQASFDLGSQAGHQVLASFDYYLRRYSEQNQIDLRRVALSLGGYFNLAPEEGNNRFLRATLDAAHYVRSGEEFLTDVGPTLTYGYAIDQKKFAQAALYYRDQDFRNTSTNSVNNLKDGDIVNASYSVRHILSDTQLLTYGIGFSRKTAEAPYETYDAVSISLGYNVIAAQLFDLGAEKWTYGVSTRIGHRRYDTNNPFQGVTDAESASTYTLTGSISVPLKNRLRLLTELGINGNRSNYDTNDFSNQFLSISVGKSF